MGVDEEVGGTFPQTLRGARTIERRGRPQPQSEQALDDAWILIAFIIALGLIFVVVAWVLAGSDVPAERANNGRGIIASSTPTRIRPCPGPRPQKGGLTQCLSNGKLARNIGECAGSGVLSQSPAEKLGVELEFEYQSWVIERLRTGVQIRLHELDLRNHLLPRITLAGSVDWAGSPRCQRGALAFFDTPGKTLLVSMRAFRRR
jgi:hypothetical protein